MKHLMRRLLVILMVCLLLPGLSLSEDIKSSSKLPTLSLTDYPASTSTSHVTITFTGGKGFTYVLDHQYKGVWLAPLRLKLGSTNGSFEADCLPGSNKFVLRNSGKARSDKTSISFTINCTDTSGAPENVTVPTPTLRKGAKGEAVKALQRALKDLGVYSGSISGTFGEATRKAVIAAQKHFGITQDGVAGPITLNHLKLATYSIPADTLGGGSSSDPGSSVRSLQKGMQGDDVRKLQKRLKELGYDPGPVDGVFGDLTLSAVLKYQKNTGLIQDGIVGPATRKMLDSGAGSLNPDPPPASGYTRYLKIGSKGKDVKAVQTRLIVLDYLHDKADGIFGKLTHRAVVAFQYDEGIEVDGIVGPETYGRLFP